MDYSIEDIKDVESDKTGGRTDDCMRNEFACAHWNVRLINIKGK